MSGPLDDAKWSRMVARGMLTREEVAYVQADTTRYWPNGEKEEKTEKKLFFATKH